MGREYLECNYPELYCEELMVPTSRFDQIATINKKVPVYYDKNVDGILHVNDGRFEHSSLKLNKYTYIIYIPFVFSQCIDVKKENEVIKYRLKEYQPIIRYAKSMKPILGQSENYITKMVF